VRIPPALPSEAGREAVKVSALLHDGAGLLGDVVEAVLGGGDVVFGGGQVVAGVATSTPAALIDGSFELASMGAGVVEFSAGGFDGVFVRLAGGLEFVEQDAEFVGASIDRVRHGAARAAP
jgi:hypothetical protein